MPRTARPAVGSRVRIVWPSDRAGYTGTVTRIEGERLYVRLDGERWRGMAPIPVRREEIRLLPPSL